MALQEQRYLAGQYFCEIVLLLLFAIITYNVFVYPRFSPLRHLPSPVQKPLWRRVFIEPTPWLFEQWMKDVPNDGVIRYSGIFNQERLLLTTSEGVRDVLVTNPYHFHKQRAQKTHLQPVLGRGLVMVEDNVHKFHRKQMSPAFSTRVVRECQSIFWKKTLEIVDLFSQTVEKQSKTQSSAGSPQPLASAVSGTTEPHGGVVEVHDPVSRAALDIIGLAGCSFDFDSLKKDESQNKMVRDYRKAFGVSRSNRIRCLLAHILPPWFVDNAPLQRNRDIALVTRLVRRLAGNIICTKRQQERCGKKARVDFLDKIMQMGGFSDTVLVEQVKTLLAAGHDTTSSTLSSAATILSQPEYQHVQEKLRAEVREYLPSLDNEELASPMVVESLPYLRAVCNETLRLFAPFSWYFRRSVVDTMVCGHAIPKGTDLILCPWALHRSPLHWGSDAERFDPDRWLKDSTGRGGAKDSCCFLTFGAGPRVCIAERFARNEVATLMAGIFGRFKVEAVPETAESPLSHQLTLTRIGGVKVKMIAMKGW